VVSSCLASRRRQDDANSNSQKLLFLRTGKFCTMSGPRYSIIPGDFATDARADVCHFRVLNLIGRHTDAEGWCRLKQIAIGAQIGLTRETVNRKLKDLVEWGYVEKSADDATGRAIFYRTIMDRGAPPKDTGDDGNAPGDDQPDMQLPHASDGNEGRVSGGSHVEYNSGQSARETSLGPVSDGSHVEYNPDGELHPTCDRMNHTRCDRTQSHYNDPSLTTLSPLTPQAGDRDDDDGSDEVDAVAAQTASRRAHAALATLADDRPRPHLAIDGLLAPLLAQRRFSAADPLVAMRDIARRLAGFPDAHVAKVLELVLAHKLRTIKADRVIAAIESVRIGGLMLVIVAGSPEFAAWRRHLDKTHPKLGRIMAAQSKWQVPSQFPPGAPQPTQPDTGA
jgi:hypothetical protein